MRSAPVIADDEFDLWVRFKLGDRMAFSNMYERYAGILYNYGFHFSNDAHIVEDAIQDLFVTLWHSRERLSDTTSIKYYLFRSLRRAIVKLSGKEQAFDRSSDYLFERVSVDSVEMQIVSGEQETEQRQHLQTALAALTPRQLEAIRLHYYEGFDVGRIASIMEMNEQSVRNILQRSLYKLRHMMPFFPLILSFFETSGL
ncbi:RNA polymerase sigma factor [Dyadobacter sp. CY323]|uniref:RNA polymerase sigma factor n=1 Tax=Dyadobacter sp. CY323 TaxID=2907302 RepID=UPI001F4687F4|nr:sigma-70 family RNA polymerase sigma factor [Dyadobacter sp. CY323]MCE6991992.1 sigma-70 family RNA polymerase sigma factor [Dyadobacter sp. CY323]